MTDNKFKLDFYVSNFTKPKSMHTNLLYGRYYSIGISWLLILFFNLISFKTNAQLVDSVVVKHHNARYYYQLGGSGSNLYEDIYNDVTIDSLVSPDRLVERYLIDNINTSATYRSRYFYTTNNKVDSISTLMCDPTCNPYSYESFDYDAMDSLVLTEKYYYNGSIPELAYQSSITFDQATNTRTECIYENFLSGNSDTAYKMTRRYDNSLRLIEKKIESGIPNLILRSDTLYFYLFNDSIDYYIRRRQAGERDSIKVNYNINGLRESEILFIDSSGVRLDKYIRSFQYDTFNKLTDVVSYANNYGTYFLNDSAHYSYNAMDLVVDIQGYFGYISSPVSFSHFHYNLNGVIDTSIYSSGPYTINPDDEDYWDTTWYEFHIVNTGIEETLADQFKIYPNPCSSGFTIQMESENVGIKNVIVWDILGNVVYNSNNSHYADINFVDTKNYSPGIYLLSATLRSGDTFNKRFVKQAF